MLLTPFDLQLPLRFMTFERGCCTFHEPRTALVALTSARVEQRADHVLFLHVQGTDLSSRTAVQGS
jgi:hypothetical protein